jgi:HK97 family phage portal protein
MAWYHRLLGTEEKLNPGQILDRGKQEGTRELVLSYEIMYERLEVVNRGVNMIVDDAADMPALVLPDNAFAGIRKNVKRSKVEQLLNREPNPFQDINSFKRSLITDYLLDGNIFIYFDGVHLYHLPSSKMRIHTDDKTFVKSYTLNNQINYAVDEIIHIKENSFHSIYRGTSRLKPAFRTMELVYSMRKFQDNFFKNGAVPGLVLKSPNTLSDKIKDRMIIAWQNRYRPDTGGRRPLILDGGIEIDTISNVSFKDLDFQNAIIENEKIILKALGIPPILLDSGNNANIRPNQRLYYLECIVPIVRKLNHAISRYFGFHIKEDISEIPALQPELRDAAAYYTSLVNGGIITAAEARERLGFEEIEGTAEIRVPANIAGSAGNPAEGGRPTEVSEEDSSNEL